MQWNSCQAHTIMPEEIQEAVDALFYRFGVLANGTGPAGTEQQGSSASKNMYDESGSIEKCDGGSSSSIHVKLNKICIRRMVGAFFILYRHLHCWTARTVVEEEDMETAAAADCEIKLHHILAASDDFSKLSMHWDLMPSAKLNYIHDFRGLFNCISQAGLLLIFCCSSFFIAFSFSLC